MKNTIFTALFISLFLVFTTNIKAADVEMTCNPNGCQQVGAIFNETGISPGKTITKSLKVTNGFSYGRSFSLEIQSSNYSDISLMGDSLMITITDNTSNMVIYGPKSITDWKNDGYINIGGIGAGDSKEYGFKVTFNDASNDYQNQKLTFDLKLGFDDVGAGTPVNISAPANTGVLGAFTNIFNPQTTMAPEATPNALPQVLGTSCFKSVTPWWIFLALEIFIFLIIIRRAKIDKWDRKKLFLALIIVAALSQIAHEATGCDCIVSVWCSRYLLLNLNGLLAAVIVGAA